MPPTSKLIPESYVSVPKSILDPCSANCMAFSNPEAPTGPKSYVVKYSVTGTIVLNLIGSGF